jgi:hypothetical protein
MMTEQMNECDMPNTVEGYVTSSVQAFLRDPPDNDYQRGFLGAMLIVASEALGLRQDASPFAEAQKLMRKRRA